MRYEKTTLESWEALPRRSVACDRSPNTRESTDTAPYPSLQLGPQATGPPYHSLILPPPRPPPPTIVRFHRGLIPLFLRPPSTRGALQGVLYWTVTRQISVYKNKKYYKKKKNDVYILFKLFCNTRLPTNNQDLK